MEACIIICSNNKPAERKGKILMINAINDVVRQNAESKLLPEHIERITRIYHSSTEIDGYSKLVSNEDLAKKDYNLNISLYAYRSQFVHAQTSLDASLSAWDECSQSVSIEYNTLMKMLEP
jgi:type I restriction enzyme M protein